MLLREAFRCERKNLVPSLPQTVLRKQPTVGAAYPLMIAVRGGFAVYQAAWFAETHSAMLGC
jgi:hypothetical protein